MKLLLIPMVCMCAVLMVDAAMAQQPAPLTEWRADIDADLSKLSMPRDAHAAVFNIMQAYERRAQMEKMRQQVPSVEPPK